MAKREYNILMKHIAITNTLMRNVVMKTFNSLKRLL